MNFSDLVLASLMLALLLLLALALGLVLRRVPEGEGARLCALAFVPLSVGQALRFVDPDIALLVVLRDPLVLAGFALLLNGLRQYLQLPRLWLWPASIVLGSLVANALFTAVWPLAAGREAMRLIGMAVLSAACLLSAAVLREPAMRPGRLFLQGVFGLLTLLSLLRLALQALPQSPVLATAEDLARLAQGLLLLGTLLGLLLLLAARLHLMIGRLSMQDALTGLLNRRGLEQMASTMLALARRLGRPVGLLLCELEPRADEPGDAPPKAFAVLLQQHFEGAELAGRVEENRFAVLLPGADPGEALRVAETLRARFAAAPLSVSVGVLSLPALHATWPRMLMLADEALREARARGGNACVLAAGGGPSPDSRKPPRAQEAQPA